MPKDNVQVSLHMEGRWIRPAGERFFFQGANGGVGLGVEEEKINSWVSENLRLFTGSACEMETQ